MSSKFLIRLSIASLRFSLISTVSLVLNVRSRATHREILSSWPILLSKFDLNQFSPRSDVSPDLNHHLIRVITKLPNSEQSYKGKVKTHNYINRQNQSTTGKL